MANGAVRGLKILLYLVVVGASAGMLYGFVKAGSSLDSCVFGDGTCVLFASMGNYSEHKARRNDCSIPKQAVAKLESFNVPLSGREDVCRFCLGSAAMQLAVCILASLLVYYRWSAHKPGRSGCSVLELAVVVLFTCLALVTTGLVTAGLEIFCKNILSGWTTSVMHHLRADLPKPSHCSEASLFKLDGASEAGVKNVEFYEGIHIARTCSFLVSGAWLIHLIVSAISVHSYRKNGPTPNEEIQSERERRRAQKEKNDKKKKKEKSASKETKRKSRSGRSGKNLSAWDEGVELV